MDLRSKSPNAQYHRLDYSPWARIFTIGANTSHAPEYLSWARIFTWIVREGFGGCSGSAWILFGSLRMRRFIRSLVNIRPMIVFGSLILGTRPFGDCERTAADCAPIQITASKWTSTFEVAEGVDAQYHVLEYYASSIFV